MRIADVLLIEAMTRIGWIAMVAMYALLGSARLARACPGHTCSAPKLAPRATAKRAPISPWQLQLVPAATERWVWEHPSWSFDAERPDAPALWASLRGRFFRRVPHATGRRLAVAAVPTVVTGTYDTVPAVGVDGQF